MKHLTKQLLKAILFISIISVYTCSLSAQNNHDKEKIEIIIKLTKFINWSQNSSFSGTKKMLYVLTEKRFNINYELKSVPSNKYGEWEIIFSENLNEIENGAVIFIANNQKEKAQRVIELSKRADILTISDNIDNFCSKGGMINLNDMADRIQFEINYPLIQNKSLEISSKVLALAKIYD
ncbi:MAG: YfiR family protein [Bacteroidales bacterium]